MSASKVAIAAIVATVLAAAANSTEPSAPPDNTSPRMPASGQSFNGPAGTSGAKGSERLREGTKLVDVVGTFQSAGGDTVSFSREGGKDSFRVLENLALQRIGLVLDENRGTRQWMVSGIITEYKSTNYLLVTKAIVLEDEVKTNGAKGTAE